MERPQVQPPIDTIRDTVKDFNRRILNPIMLSFAGRTYSFISAIRHTGRKSGQEYITPVIGAPRLDGFVVPLTYGQDVDWLKNVLAAGRCEIVYHGQVFQATAPEVVPVDQILDAFPDWTHSLIRIPAQEALKLDRMAEAPDSAAEYQEFSREYPSERGWWVVIALLFLLFGLRRRR